jgi:hypothetical protein
VNDPNLRYRQVAIAAVENTGSWAEITPGENVDMTILRASGAFQLASSATPGADYMPIPSGTAYEHLGGDSIYVRMLKAGVVQAARYS